MYQTPNSCSTCPLSSAKWNPNRVAFYIDSKVWPNNFSFFCAHMLVLVFFFVKHISLYHSLPELNSKAFFFRLRSMCKKNRAFSRELSFSLFSLVIACHIVRIKRNRFVDIVTLWCYDDGQTHHILFQRTPT